MTIKPEAALAKRVRDNLPGCKITRIESRASLGFPDCVIAFEKTGRFVPVELKVVQAGLKVDLRPHQISFHYAHADIGCKTYILVEYWPPKGEKELRLYSGAQAIELQKQGLRLPALNSWPLRGMQWGELAEIIC